MENQIVCPSCGTTLPNNEIIRDAVEGKAPYKRHMMCACGEKITYWQITAQLRDQKKFGWRLQNWVRSLSINRGH